MLPLVFGELSPIARLDVDPESVRGPQDPLPGRVALCVRDALDLIEAGDRVSHVCRVVQRLLALVRKRELRVAEPVPFGGRHAEAAVSALVVSSGLRLLDVLSGGLLLLLRRHRSNLLIRRPATAANRAFVGGCGAGPTAPSDSVLRAERGLGRPACAHVRNLPHERAALTDVLLLHRDGVARITRGGLARLEDREALQRCPAQDQCRAGSPETAAAQGRNAQAESGRSLGGPRVAACRTLPIGLTQQSQPALHDVSRN